MVDIPRPGTEAAAFVARQQGRMLPDIRPQGFSQLATTDIRQGGFQQMPSRRSVVPSAGGFASPRAEAGSNVGRLHSTEPRPIPMTASGAGGSGGASSAPTGKPGGEERTEIPRGTAGGGRIGPPEGRTLQGGPDREEPHGEIELIQRAPVALADLAGGIIPDRRDFSPAVPIAKDIYRKYAQAPLTVLSVTRNGATEYIVAGPPLTPLEVNAFLHLAAPGKVNDLDTKDILNDWRALGELTNARRQELWNMHAAMPGWNESEADRISLYYLLDMNYDRRTRSFKEPGPNAYALPILRLRDDPRGNIININPLDPELRTALSEALPPAINDPWRFNVGLGLTFHAAYAESNTRWPDIDRIDPLDTTGDSMVIGAAQVFAYTYRMLEQQKIARETQDPVLAAALAVPANQDMQQSPFITGLLAYAQTGIIPPQALHER